MGLLSRIFRPSALRAVEGEYRPGPYFLNDGWLSATAGRFWNFWQLGYNVQPYGQASAMTEACVSAYAQTVAMCPGGHWRTEANGGRVLVTNSSLARILKRPNDYQSMSDLLLNATRRLYESGQAFGVALRNGRGEIEQLHLMRTGTPLVAEDGSIFYGLTGNEILDRRYDLSAPIPARDVLHIRLHTPRHPLKGESPILAAALDLAMAGAALNQQVSFYINQAKPSFMLETEQQLTAEQTKALRDRWNEQTQGENAGGTPILTWGLKAKAVTTTANDGQLAEMLKMTEQNVALAFRVPLQILGVGGTPFASTEALMSSWIASGLGFALNHIEEAFGLLFGLGGMPDEYLEFDTDALLRSAFKDRIDGLSKGVLGAIFAPDEARAKVGLPAVPGGYGAMPRVQQQVVGLDWHDKNPAPTPAPPSNDDEDEDADDDLSADEKTAASTAYGYAAFKEMRPLLALPKPNPGATGAGIGAV